MVSWNLAALARQWRSGSAGPISGVDGLKGLNGRAYVASAVSKLHDTGGTGIPLTTGRPRLVILGSGWAAARLLRDINPDLYDFTVRLLHSLISHAGFKANVCEDYRNCDGQLPYLITVTIRL